MSAVQATTTRDRPWHLWVIGSIGVLWSLMGLVSYVLTQVNVEAIMSEFPPRQRAYFASFPLWADAFWGLGVFGGAIGCLLLLLGHRLAFPVLLAATIGTIVSTLGGLFLLGGMDVMRETGGVGLTLVPVIVAVLLAAYARASQRSPD